VREIMVNVSHLAERVQHYFGDGRRFGVRIGYSFEGHLDGDRLVPEPIGSAGALRKINDFGGFIDRTTAVLCGDAVVDLDLQAAARTHHDQAAIATVVTREVALEEVSNYGIVVASADGRVTSFQEKPTPAEARSRLASTGIYLLEPEALAFIPPGVTYDIGSELFPDLVRQRKPFYTQCHDFEWLDIGRVADYWRIVQRLLRGEVPSIPVPGEQVRPGVWIGLNTRVHWDSVKISGPVHIGSGAWIEAGAVLRGPLWVGEGCHVEAGAQVERSILFDYAHVGANAVVRDMIVSGRYCVQHDGAQAPQAGPARWWGDARSRRADGRPVQ
jgi:mannose-1-phosphate guanylyltransferase